MRRLLALAAATSTALSIAACSSAPAKTPEQARCDQAQQAFTNFTEEAGKPVQPLRSGTTEEFSANEKQRRNFEMNGRLAANVALTNQTCFKPETVAVMKAYLDNLNASQ